MVDLTPDDLVVAANTLEKLSRVLEYSNPARAMWTADEIRGEIARIREEIEQDAVCADLADDLVKATIVQYGYAPLAGPDPLKEANLLAA